MIDAEAKKIMAERERERRIKMKNYSTGILIGLLIGMILFPFFQEFLGDYDIWAKSTYYRIKFHKLPSTIKSEREKNLNSDCETIESGMGILLGLRKKDGITNALLYKNGYSQSIGGLGEGITSEDVKNKIIERSKSMVFENMKAAKEYQENLKRSGVENIILGLRITKENIK